MKRRITNISSHIYTSSTKNVDKDLIMKPSSTTSHQSRRLVTIPQALTWAAAAASISFVVTSLFAAQIVRLYAIAPAITSDQIFSSVQRSALRSSSSFSSTIKNSATDDIHAMLPFTTPPPFSQGPAVCLMVSYPNSGTSYTIHMVRQASNHTTATNYALEGDIRDRPSIPIHGNVPNAEQGPFLELTLNETTIVPKKYILTKTHCGGFCSDCTPPGYVETDRSFMINCLTGRRAFFNESGNLVTESVTYNRSIVKKVVHIIRHPLDNIVARFHLDYNRQTEKWQRNHPYNQTGFLKWCSLYDRRSRLLHQRHIDRTMRTLLAAIPCHEEFYRYVQWHNLAFITTEQLAVPVHIIRYQDYTTNYEETLSSVLAFLELPDTGEREPFHAGKEYRDYYTHEHRASIWAFLQEFASRQTLEFMKEYANDFY